MSRPVSSFAIEIKHRREIQLHTMAIFGNNSADSTVPQAKNEFLSIVDDFVSKEPNALYLIDWEKNSPKSVICRKNSNGGQTCLNIDAEGITLFKKMQQVNYFCSLPAKVDDTHFECRKIQ